MATKKSQDQSEKFAAYEQSLTQVKERARLYDEKFFSGCILPTPEQARARRRELIKHVLTSD